MLTLLQHPDAVVYLGPFGFFGRRLHRELRACRVARLGHVIWRGYFLHVNRMGKAWRTEPITRLAECTRSTARGAILFVTAPDLADFEGPRESTCSAFTIEALFLPRPETFVRHHGIH